MAFITHNMKKPDDLISQNIWSQL